MEHFEKLVLDMAQYKILMWFNYINGKFVVWSNGPERLYDFINHIKFKMMQSAMEIDQAVQSLFWMYLPPEMGRH
jgi:hypothetical protein